MELVQFKVHECGNSADHAFYRAVELAQSEYGAASQTGTIADREESKLVMFETKRDADPVEHIDEIMETTIKTHEDPVGYIDLSDGEYLFFGWAMKDPGEFVEPR